MIFTTVVWPYEIWPNKIIWNNSRLFCWKPYIMCDGKVHFRCTQYTKENSQSCNVSYTENMGDFKRFSLLALNVPCTCSLTKDVMCNLEIYVEWKLLLNHAIMDRIGPRKRNIVYFSFHDVPMLIHFLLILLIDIINPIRWLLSGNSGFLHHGRRTIWMRSYLTITKCIMVNNVKIRWQWRT